MNELLELVKLYVNECGVSRPRHPFLNTMVVNNLSYTVDSRTTAQISIDKAKEDLKKAEQCLKCEQVTVKLLDFIEAQK